MENKNRNRINPRMLDVRPANYDGDLDMPKADHVEIVNRSSPKPERWLAEVDVRRHFGDIRRPSPVKPRAATFRSETMWDIDRDFQSVATPGFKKNIEAPIDNKYTDRFNAVAPLNQATAYDDATRIEIEDDMGQLFFGDSFSEKKLAHIGHVDDANDALDSQIQLTAQDEIKQADQIKKNKAESLSALFDVSISTEYKKLFFSFAGIAIFIFLIIIGTSFFNEGMRIKDSVLGTGKDAYLDLAMAKDGIAGRDFQKSSFEFGEAYDKFEKISQDINGLGGILVETSRFVPFFSKISSGSSMAQVGRDVSRIGILAGEVMQSMDGIKNPLKNDGSTVSFLKIFQDTDKNLREIAILTKNVQENLDKVNVDDIPEKQRAQFVDLKSKLPEMNLFLAEFIDNSQIFTDVLGGNGPRKYLFLFQNNQEMRATGGFIGTYGVMDIFNGNVRRFFIDGIFNPDGQLREKVIPPVPIQKISAAWSLHDSNWFPDFPKSAEKAAWFYEKTGGPTVDGVITMTPTVMQKLLDISGPVELPEYGVTVDKDNFVEKIQYEVEVDYDKELNKPKQIIADLAPKILDKIFNARSFSDMTKTMNVLSESLNEKQILIYSKNSEIENVLSRQGWSGELLETQKDYLSVINTNINGYKTDGVVDEKIEHKAEIQADGSVVDTVTITRHHNGGSLEHSWWNKVNADYMRVYVPIGSTLLSTDGQTREYNSPPLDYKALNFKKDAQVKMEEDSLKIDEESGTKIYDDSGKTVFANWVYVSPQETVIIKYKYLLPFKLSMDAENKPADTYALLAQKQSGSLGSGFVSEISYPDNYKMIWNYPEQVMRETNSMKVETDLKSDKFIGTAFIQR